jgi:nucleoside-diphosphate-sugar epimerase
MKVVIIGSGGFIGRHLQNFMQSEGIQVCGISSKGSKGINPDTGVLSDEFFIPAGTSTVIYLAQSPFYRKVPEMSQHLFNVNVQSAVKIAELARRAKVGRFIYASSGNVYASSFETLSESSPLRRDNWYSLSKIHAEEALSLYRSDMDLTVMRIFGIYGPGQDDKLVPNLISSVLEGREISIARNPKDENDLDGLRISLCYIDDAVRILHDLIIQGGPPYINIAGNEAVSLRRIATIMGSCLRKNVACKILDQYRQFDLIADIALLQNTLNPRFTRLEAGLQKTVENRITAQ